MNTEPELRIDAHAILGEGPIWDHGRQVLYWIDIMKHELHIYDPVANQDTVVDVGQAIGTVVIRSSGGLMLALHHGFAAFDPQTRALTMINDPESHLPDNRFNDGKCDPAGRFWAGTMAVDPKGDEGALYRLDTDLSVHKMLDKISISNGIVWNLDHTKMYYIDSLSCCVRVYDYDNESGEIRNESVIIRISQEMGLPDGMAIDAEGMLWIAQYGGYRVCRWHPGTGQMLQTIDLPAANVTACAFADKDLDTLYITTASAGLSDQERQQQPHAGGLFSIKPGVRGVESFQFQG